MDYISIRVNTLRGDQKIGFDAYILLDGKYVHYLREGDSFEGHRLERLKSKKLKKLYIRTESEKLYRDYVEKNIEAAYTNKDKDLKTRAEVIQGDQEFHTDEVFENPENSVAYHKAKTAAGKYVDFLLQNTEAAQSVLAIQNTDHSISHHCVNVATLAVALATELKLFDDKQKQMLTLGCLLHDYGHFNTPFDFSKRLQDLSKEEQKNYWLHPKSGAEKVKDLRHFDKQVINIIYQHEELVNGSGPLKLREKDQDPLAVIASTANALDRILLFEGQDRSKALKAFMMDNVGKHPLNHINALSQFFTK